MFKSKIKLKKTFGGEMGLIPRYSHMSTLPDKALFSQSPTWEKKIMVTHVGDCENSAFPGRVDIWKYQNTTTFYSS